MTVNIAKYYLLIDFEATCKKDQKIHNQEIIEFPVKLITADGKDVAEFHKFVKPIMNPLLTEFCKELTGIDQKTVNDAQGWADVWCEFNMFLFEHGINGTNTVTFTFGDWDLKTMLPCQMKMYSSMYIPKGMNRIPTVLKTWINLKSVYQEVYNESVGSLSDMVTKANLEFVGTPHSGISDTRSMTAVLKKIIQEKDYYVEIPSIQ